MQDRHVTCREIAASLGISFTSIHSILHEHLAVKKDCSRWTPHNLTSAQKKARASMLMRPKQNSKDEPNPTKVVRIKWSAVSLIKLVM